MASEAVSRKLDYLNQCLRDGAMLKVDDPEAWSLLRFLNEDMLGTVDEARALASHMVRFIETFLRLKKHLHPKRDSAIVETGSLSTLAKFMNSVGYNVTPCFGDFRYGLEIDSGVADILLALEVFEHVKDHDSVAISDIDIFNFSGINRFLQECRRLLRPQGHLIITTPNACSLRCLVNLVNFQSPVTFYPHVKEYAPQDVIDLCQNNGLRLVVFETCFAYYYLGSDRTKVIEDYLTRPGFPSENRGDCSFFIFTRDDTP